MNPKTRNAVGVVPTHAATVIIGGGVIGTSVAYHLAQLGANDVVLLEQDELTSGTTWHAAGLMVTFGHISETATELRKYSRDLYARLEEETGQSTGLRQCGFVELVCGAESLHEHRRIAAINRYHGVDVQEISPAEVQQLFPIANVDNLDAGFYVQDDGRVNPVDVTMALAKGARARGVRIITGVPVTGITRDRDTVTGVVTDKGTITCETVVNCAGMWARQLGQQHGVVIPNQAAEHYYLVTEKIDGISADWPVIEDPSNYGYIREEAGGLMLGLFETEAAPWNVEAIPRDFSFGEIEPNWERMTPYLERAMSRVPMTLDVGIRKFFCGPESFTPDRHPIVGESASLRNYFVAAGLNSVGILTGGGVGRVLAHWIVNGRPDVDITGIRADRFQPYQNTPQYRAQRVTETLGWAYQIHYPTKAPATARMAKRSPLHDRLAEAGACFTDVSGWEGPAWFARGEQPETAGDMSWGRMHWWPHWQAEHKACREAVALFDMSFMAKFLVQGRDAGKVLDRISANCVNEQSGRITYTQWLNELGQIEADVTVINIDQERFMVVVSDTEHVQALTWLRRNTPDDAHAFATDVTSGVTQINVQGPNSRALLQELTEADLSNGSFPFRTAREIDLGLARVLCVRITYVGELGYELYVPTEQAIHVYDLIVSTGAKHGLVHAGLMALRSLRSEKAYRDYGHDIDNLDSPYDVGLGFAVKLSKPSGFIGQEAARDRKSQATSSRQLVQVLVGDPEPMLWHGEILFRDGKAVGDVRSGSYGHTLGGAVGLAMITDIEGGQVDADYVGSGHWEVEIAGKRYPCSCSLKPMYDPKMEKIKA